MCRNGHQSTAQTCNYSVAALLKAYRKNIPIAIILDGDKHAQKSNAVWFVAPTHASVVLFSPS